MDTFRLNPFDQLKLNIDQKTVFQPFSHEATSFNNKSLELLIFFVLKGYDLHKIVLDYLDDKIALSDRSRISEIKNAFINYHEKLEQEFDSETKYYTKSLLNQLKTDYSRILFKAENISLENEVDLVEFYIQMSNQIEGFVKAAKLASYPSSLSLRKLITAFVEDDRKVYEYLSKLWQIDLEEDISEKIHIKDVEFENDISNKKYIESISINLWRERGLYTFFLNSILPDLKSNYITYLHPVYDTPSTQYINTLIKKFYPLEDHEKLKTDEDLRRERILDFAEKTIEILWLNNSYFDDPVFFVRNNYPLNDIANQYIPELFERNLISICIKDNEEPDISLYNKLLNGDVVEYNFKLNYIHRFFDIVHLIKERDVLIISSYLGKYDNKIGLIKKGSNIIELRKENLTLYCLQMKSVYCTSYPNFWGKNNEIRSLNISQYPVLKSLIPQRVTISPVQKNKKKIYSIYYGCPIKIELASMSNESIEIMCTEWLRSEYAPNEFKIKFQLIKTGGNYADIDILGCNSYNEIIACQVTNTENEKLIREKKQKLENFISDKKIMFTHLETYLKTQKDFNKNLTEVWNDLINDSNYNKLIEKLIIS